MESFIWNVHRSDSGFIFVVSAPSGTGKTTLCQALVRDFSTIKYTVSCTTRAQRVGEVNGKHYHFLSKQEFLYKVKNGDFAEWAEVYGNLYGTLKADIVELNEHGFDVLMDIDTQGAMQIKQSFPHAVLIFILPPSVKILKQRLLNRNTDTEAVIRSRLQKVNDEVQALWHFDYLVINDLFEQALQALEAIVVTEKGRINNVNPGWVEHFLHGLE
ncbi:MAG TPA: guanylate kinase [Thermodesulfovibrionia bacterium]|nr:guanylate kinase [Thermodesulfovibrionia bacterium]